MGTFRGSWLRSNPNQTNTADTASLVNASNSSTAGQLDPLTVLDNPPHLLLHESTGVIILRLGPPGSSSSSSEG
eukprot:CAMPEP_0202875292 /NCGR_PEP_ID=MMETSP1391-20130828/27014_1 /ASSEMBLY_ACC=CAM_ASM_000867 /TAXON_ID=1034604 /ORGANISM="Chlamydomonas leiostraca, Strain SAG 11-49" /LENGTH=73 /DNA_ID=CAMNT_0049556935 /DNA_START=187 /DNA_END=404 /DNA_ORIENTATION=-